MRVREQDADYVVEIRDDLCSHCHERPADRADSVPACRHCRQEWALLRRWIARLERPTRASSAALIQAYEAATGTLVGCD
jgi:hypothetical protein